jgi:hypothetical protein
MSDTYECSRCDDPEHPELGKSHVFEFDDVRRRKTANAALKLATQDQWAFLSRQSPANPVVSMPSNATSSARFMSLSYYGGGFPMVGNCKEDLEYYSPGWLMRTIPSFMAESYLWNRHNSIGANESPPNENMPREPDRAIKDLNPRTGVGLGGVVGFVSGQVPGEGDSLPPLDIITTGPPDLITSTSVVYRTSRLALYVPIYKVLSASDGQPAELPEAYASANVEVALSRIHRFEAGDYLFIDSFGGTVNEHGLMIVGYGPAVFLRHQPWPADRQDFIDEYNGTISEIMSGIRVSSWDYDEKGWRIDVDLPATYDTSKYIDTNIRVPYVVDWNVKNAPSSWLVRQQPRPFYFTRYPLPGINQSGQFHFNHNYWLFVPAADSMIVRCDWFYAENVRGDQNAPFLIETNRYNPIIIEANAPLPPAPDDNIPEGPQ